MNNKNTKLLMVGLLVIYGIALAGVSYYVFSPKAPATKLPATTAPTQTVTPRPVVSSGTVRVTSDTSGQIYLENGGEKLAVIQLVITLPYSSDLANVKAQILPKELNVIENRVVVDKAKTKITIAIGAYSDTGYLPMGQTVLASLTVNGKPIAGVKPAFDKEFSKMISLNRQTNLPLVFN